MRCSVSVDIAFQMLMNTTSSKAFFRRRAWLAGLALASPALLWFAVFMVGPLAFSFYASTLRWNGLLSSPIEIGVDNYARILSDPRFWRAVNNSAVSRRRSRWASS